MNDRPTNDKPSTLNEREILTIWADAVRLHPPRVGLERLPETLATLRRTYLNFRDGEQSSGD